jgi:hypothetical protein
VQRLESAFRFVDLNFRMAKSHEAIQKPWMYLSLGGGVLTLLSMASLGVLLVGVGSRPFVWILIGVMALCYLLGLQVWGEITALRTAQIFASLIQDGEDYQPAGSSMRVFATHWAKVLVYVVSLPCLSLILGLQEVFSGPSRPKQAWKKVHPLLLPLLALEGLGLRESFNRIKEIVEANLLRFQPSYLPVGLIARGVEWALALVGAAAGVFIAARIADPLTAGPWRAFGAASVGLAVAGLFWMGGIAFSSFFRTCYHTALVVWALNVEKAQKRQGEGSASPPEIISRAMRKKPRSGKEGSDATKT